MSESQPASVWPYSRHLLICTGGACAPVAAGNDLKRRFDEMAQAEGRQWLSDPRRVLCSACTCLGVCAGGPIVVVYPEGIWYGRVDKAALERIFYEHILQGRPVEELVLYRLYPPAIRRS